MARKIIDFRSDQELTDYINSIAWSDSGDDGFSSDESETYPELNIDKLLHGLDSESGSTTSETVGGPANDMENAHIIHIVDGDIDKNPHMEANKGKTLSLRENLLHFSKRDLYLLQIMKKTQ